MNYKNEYEQWLKSLTRATSLDDFAEPRGLKIREFQCYIDHCGSDEPHPPHQTQGSRPVAERSTRTTGGKVCLGHAWDYEIVQTLRPDVGPPKRTVVWRE